MKESTRAWIYRATLGILPLLVAYGIVASDKAPFIVAAVAAIFPAGLAAKNTSTKGDS